ncbi:ATP-binding protein [Sphingorhabdus sp. Alg239-R122]|uniref:sensor histidine kinase n=1 Tax=Sphingorhabdus sp. Alg239-R122 TaxID=2305989 RepID=UPI0013DB9052|nr:ATP-binding protein [Sphingorhabdus sp. Alg239-R122]
MILIATVWISLLLLGGGIALDRTLRSIITNNFDEQLEYVQTAMVASAEIGPDGEVFFNRPLGDQRFLEPNSGFYWQISGEGHDDFPSRSLWDRALEVPDNHQDAEPHIYDSNQFGDEQLRVIERAVYLPGSETRWWVIVAQDRGGLDKQLAQTRSTLTKSFALLALGLIVLAALQTLYGLWPLRRVRQAIVQMRTGRKNRVTETLPLEVMPMVDELNALLAHNEKQAEEARRHAGNLAHALKTPLTVVMNAATAKADDLSDTVIREAAVMRRQVDHHLARARAVGRRGQALSVASVWESVEAVERAVTQLYPHVRFDLDGSKKARVAAERQDLDEMLGNLIENAAKYGGGSVFVTIDTGRQAGVEEPKMVEVWVEDDGMGIPEEERQRIFDRGARLDTGKPGTGLGLAIVRDVAEIYDGNVSLDESEDLGGLLVRLQLPRVPDEIEV